MPKKSFAEINTPVTKSGKKVYSNSCGVLDGVTSIDNLSNENTSSIDKFIVNPESSGQVKNKFTIYPKDNLCGYNGDKADSEAAGIFFTKDQNLPHKGIKYVTMPESQERLMKPQKHIINTKSNLVIDNNQISGADINKIRFSLHWFSRN